MHGRKPRADYSREPSTNIKEKGETPFGFGELGIQESEQWEYREWFKRITVLGECIKTRVNMKWLDKRAGKQGYLRVKLNKPLHHFILIYMQQVNKVYIDFDKFIDAVHHEVCSNFPIMKRSEKNPEFDDVIIEFLDENGIIPVIKNKSLYYGKYV